ncbi:MAG: helix-turn-helix domain-containing protein, partial [Candidatus Bathyarchaeota archaeon]|nr:helix-turn-helix domain-containing protein [Candidatus Bathyarchaeota archaeon]
MIKQRDKSKIIQIWGDILDYGFTSVPNILLRYRSNLGIKSQHLALIIDIMSFKWDSESPFPSYSTLAQRAGVDERSIKRITQDLEELSLLIKTPRFDDETGAQITTIFDFRPLVKKLIEEMNQTTFDVESLIATNSTISKKEGDKFVTGGVTNN